MRGFVRILGLVALSLSLPTAIFAADYGDFTAGMEKKEGLADIYVDHAKAKVYLELDGAASGEVGRFIYAAYLTAGLGSNPLGLDRSVPRGGKMLVFRRAGEQVMAVVENTRFRASADNPAEKKAVKTSFAESIIWSTDVKATDAEAGTVLIDLTDFLKQDTVGVAARISARGEGSFSADHKRSYVDTAEVHAFPLNLEFDAYVTFASKKPGSEIRGTTPVPEAVTLIAHTTFMKLPEPGYEIRMGDERAGVLSDAHIDMSAPLTGDTVVRLAERFRLEKDEDGKVKKPIVFYIDNGAPEPIRSALLEGANWWATAFEKAGFPGGYRAEILPEDAHPLDARYNVVNWVHRATRGWSYGASITDPRTGEILRGVVLLGSLRVRQDIKIFEALAGAAKTGTGEAEDPVELALARIRQLSAHEIGHSIGFAHNMGASSYDGRASVMDYPAPDVRYADGGLDFSNAYGVGMGTWDDWTVKFLYSDYGDLSDHQAQAKLIAEADAAGLLYVSDGDSRSVGTGHYKGALWDTGEDAVESLLNTMAVRRHALDRFGEANLRSGESYRALQTKFVPLYLYHRYQLQAAAKFIGGLDYVYRHEGDGRKETSFVSPAEQARALDALMQTLTPEALLVPADVQLALSPLGYADGDPQFWRETFSDSGRPMFDESGPASVAANLTYDALLHPRRLLRVYEQGLKADGFVGLNAYLSSIVGGVARLPKKEAAALGAVRRVTVDALAEQLIRLTFSQEAAMPVRVGAVTALEELKGLLGRYKGADAAFGAALTGRIDTAMARARTPAVKEPKRETTPPGSPIGAGGFLDQGLGESCWHCD